MSITRFPHGVSSFGVPLFGGDPTIGNVYYVMQNTSATFYQDWYDAHYSGYEDGSVNIYSTIASALSATVSERNDYVMVMPDSDTYTLTTTLTMNKHNVHLICPAGIRTSGVGANTSAALYMTTVDTATVTLTGNNCEIAGFRFVNSAAQTLISTTGHVNVPTANTAHGVEIHHNWFEPTASGSDNAPFICFYNGGSGNRCNVHHNVFRLVNPSTTMSYGCYLNGAYCDFSYNDMIVQNGATITWGVRMPGSGGIIKYNNFVASRAGGGLSAGGFGGAVLIDTQDQTAGIGNRGAVGTGTMIEGGTADTSWCDNLGGVNGGLTPLDQNLDA